MTPTLRQLVNLSRVTDESNWNAKKKKKKNEAIKMVHGLKMKETQGEASLWIHFSNRSKGSGKDEK